MKFAGEVCDFCGEDEQGRVTRAAVSFDRRDNGGTFSLCEHHWNDGHGPDEPRSWQYHGQYAETHRRARSLSQLRGGRTEDERRPDDKPCDVCGLWFSAQGMAKHRAMHQEQDD
jgi:hypothetical protein